jgi:hypothetical protein
LRLIGVLPKLSMQPVQILLQPVFERLDLTLSTPLAPWLARTRSHASFKFLRAYTLSTKEWTFSLRPSRTR